MARLWVGAGDDSLSRQQLEVYFALMFLMALSKWKLVLELLCAAGSFTQTLYFLCLASALLPIPVGKSISPNSWVELFVVVFNLG